uniref:HAT C-terminal dimerisation domain-containing protein n=1 Tax=Latimeria chalumnae TaxID=7897 RepID=H3BCP4_LATCH
QTGKLTTILADCVYLDAVNYTTVSQAIIKTISKYGADFDKVSALISDNATYMTFKSVLQGVMPNAVHITCNAHIISLVNISTLLNDAQLNDEVQFVAKNAAGLMDLITWFESRYVTIHEAYNKVMDVLCWAEAQSNENHSDDTELNARAQQVFSCMAKKLRQYYCYEEDSSDAEKKAQKFKQPAAVFLKTVRIFDPAQMHLLMLDLSSLNIIPGFNKNCRLEIPVYKNIAKEVDCTLPVLQFWKRIPHLARLARRCLTIPTNSVDAERAVSKHRQVFSAQRQGMKTQLQDAPCSRSTTDLL